MQKATDMLIPVSHAL